MSARFVYVLTLLLVVSLAVATPVLPDGQYCGTASGNAFKLSFSCRNDATRVRPRLAHILRKSASLQTAGHCNVTVTSFGSSFPTCAHEPFADAGTYIQFPHFNATHSGCMNTVLQEFWITGFTAEVVPGPAVLLTAGAFSMSMTPNQC